MADPAKAARDGQGRDSRSPGARKARVPDAPRRLSPKALSRMKAKNTELEAMNARIGTENAEWLEQVKLLQGSISLSEESTAAADARRAMFAGLAGLCEQRAETLTRHEADEELRWETARAKCERETAALREEFTSLQRHTAQLKQAAVHVSQETRDFDEGLTRGVQERRDLQAQCLGLQQECENARVELQGVRDALTESGKTIERMAKRKLEAEWQLQQRAQRGEAVRRMDSEVRRGLCSDAVAERSRRQQLVGVAELEADQHRAAADRHKHVAVEHQREAHTLGRETALLEGEAQELAGEAARLEEEIQDVERDAVEEQRLEAAALKLLRAGHARREALERQLARLHGANDRVAAAGADLQEMHARELFSRAKREAQRVLRGEPSSPIPGEGDGRPRAVAQERALEAARKPVPAALDLAGEVVRKPAPSQEERPARSGAKTPTGVCSPMGLGARSPKGAGSRTPTRSGARTPTRAGPL